MLTPPEKLLFIAFFIASLVGATITFRRMIRVIRRGHGRLNTNDIARRLIDALVTFVFQPRLPRQRPTVAIFHYAVAWGFICFLLANAVDVLEAWHPGYRFLHTSSPSGPYRLLIDLMSGAILTGITFFLVRRFIGKSSALTLRPNVVLHADAPRRIAVDSLIVGLFILGHVGFRFLAASFAIAAGGPDTWQPLAGFVAGAWDGWSNPTIEMGWHLSWWLAVGLIFAFIPYFPYSKHAHLFMGPLNFLTRPNRTSPGSLDPLDFNDASIERFGAERITDLSRTQIVDAFACIMCNRCQDVCPPYLTGKELSPAALEINKRLHLKSHLRALSSGAEDTSTLVGETISDSAVWSCLACGACADVCPVGNEPMHDIMDIRRAQILMRGQFPGELKNAYTGLERQANPWQMGDDRTDWTGALDFELPTVSRNPDFELLYWVGCAGAFDPRARQTAQAIATLLHRAGVNIAILGNDEACTGDLARRTGNEYLFSELAQRNIQTLREAGADRKEIVAGCPHCVHTLKNEYPALGGTFAVSHHTRYLQALIAKGRLTVDASVSRSVTFHDPCYLGRQNGVFEEPRMVLGSAGASLIEMGRNRRNSFCCGGGGGQVWKEEEAGEQAVSDIRYDEARSTGAETLAVGCPFCTRMLADAGDRAGDSMVVKDVAEILLETM